MDEANRLTVGPMGFSGKTSFIGCKIGALNRLPASFFVSVAYDCWAFRRLGVHVDATQRRDHRAGCIARATTPSPPMLAPGAVAAGFPRTGREIPLAGADLRRADPRAEGRRRRPRSPGPMFTGRDAVHAHLMKHDPPVDLRGARALPLRAGRGEGTAGGWRVTAAGPTTSIREEPYQAEILKRYGVRVVIGKGGMGAKTLAGLKESGAVYLNAIGGAAQFYARCIERVTGVSLMEFGTPEAMWHLEVRDFPAIVTMDAHGNSLHKDVEEESGAVLETLQRVLTPDHFNASANSALDAPPRIAHLEVNAHGAPVVRFERLVVAERLRPLQLRERVTGLGNRRLRLVLPRDHERERRVGSALVDTARGVQVARPDAERAGHSRATDALANARRSPLTSLSAGRYERNAT